MANERIFIVAIAAVWHTSAVLYNTMCIIVLQLLQLENLLYIAINIHIRCRVGGGREYHCCAATNENVFAIRMISC